MIEILDPTVQPGAGDPATGPTWAPRPDSLAGRRIGLIENTKHNSDRLLQRIGDLLKSEYGAAETRMWRKRNSSVPAHEEIIAELKQSCDVMVAGIGD
jgi:hypothetical protein